MKDEEKKTRFQHSCERDIKYMKEGAEVANELHEAERKKWAEEKEKYEQVAYAKGFNDCKEATMIWLKKNLIIMSKKVKE